MQKSLQFLNSIPDERVKLFKQFLESPFLNSNKKLLEIFELRNKKVKDLGTLYSLLYPSKPLNLQVVKNLLSSLKKQYKHFLAVVALKKNDTLLDYLAQEELNLNEKEFDFSIKKNDKTLLKESLLTIPMIGGHIMEEVTGAMNRDAKIEDFISILNSQFTLNEANYSIRKIIILNYFNLLNKNFDSNLIPQWGHQATSNLKINEEVRSFPLMVLYEKSFILTKFKKEKDFYLLKKDLDRFIKQLHIDHIYFVFSVLSNFAVSQLNIGNEKYTEELFYLHILLIGKYEKFWRTEKLVINFIKIGCRLKKSTKVEEYLTENKNKINTNAYYYSLALMHFYKNENSKSLDHLQRVKFSNPASAFNSRILIINNFIKLQELEAAENHAESLRVYLVRSKNITRKRKDRHLNYLKVLIKILQLKRKKGFLKLKNYLKMKKDLESAIAGNTQLLQKKYLLSLLPED